MEKATRTQAHGEPMLPQELMNKSTSWLGRSNQYPVFSKSWYIYRMASYGVPMLVVTLVLLMLGVFTASLIDGVDAFLALGAVWLVIAVALSLGRGLAVLACLQKWTPVREASAVVCAIVAGILISLAITPFTRTAPPADRPAPPAHVVEEEQRNKLLNLAIWLPVLGWLGGSVDLVSYFRQRRLLRESELREQLARYRDERNEVEMKLAVLASQVEPHFLFNTLSGVRAAMLSDPARGIVLIDHLVDYLRSTIPQLRADGAHSFVALGSQLDSVGAYLGIIAARLPRLTFEVECPHALRDAAIPPLMLISLVENAVKHGIELKKGPAQIRVTATQVGDARLELSVADDGVGFGSATKGSGIGLSNIRERLQHLYGAEAALSLRASEQGGIVASIVLPLRVAQPGTN
jgi:signal transduction histidine kinase